MLLTPGGASSRIPISTWAKSLRDLSTLAQVQEARTTTGLTGEPRTARDMNNQSVVAVYARVAGPGWLVFVELPIEDWTKY